MIAALGLLSIVAGAAAAFAAQRLPAYNEALETGAGLLLIGGFALTGAMLPAML